MTSQKEVNCVVNIMHIFSSKKGEIIDCYYILIEKEEIGDIFSQFTTIDNFELWIYPVVEGNEMKPRMLKLSSWGQTKMPNGNIIYTIVGEGGGSIVGTTKDWTLRQGNNPPLELVSIQYSQEDHGSLAFMKYFEALREVYPSL